MNKLRLLLLALSLAVSLSAHAKSDAYYSQALDIDFALEEESLKTTLERIINQLFAFITPIADDSMYLDFGYYSDMQRELEK